MRKNKIISNQKPSENLHYAKFSDGFSFMKCCNYSEIF